MFIILWRYLSLFGTFYRGCAGVSQRGQTGLATPELHRGMVGQRWVMCSCIRRRPRGHWRSRGAPARLTANEFYDFWDFSNKTPKYPTTDPLQLLLVLFGPRSPRGRAGAPRDLQGPRGRRLMHKHITQRCPSIPWRSSDVPEPVRGRLQRPWEP